MTVEWSAFFPRVLPHVRGCPAPVAIQAIRDAAMEFCQKTWIWQEVVDMDFVEDDVDVTITLPSDSKLIAIKDFIEDDRKYEPDDFLIRDNEVILTKAAEETETIEGRVILAPYKTSTTCPEWLYNDHDVAIAEGAKARLMFDAKQIWANSELATLSLNFFRKAINTEKIKIFQGYAGRNKRVKARRFV